MNIRKLIASLILAFALLPVAFASTEFKGTETVNINKANAATLAAYLKGVGPNKAEAIVKYRKANGKFKSVSDLNNVPGIGDETFKDIKKNVSTSRGKSVAPDGYKMGETSGKSTSKRKTKSTSSKSSSKSSKSDTKKSTKSSSSDSKSSSSKSKKLSDKGSSSSKSKKTKSSDSKAKSTKSKAKSKKSELKSKAKKKTTSSKSKSTKSKAKKTKKTKKKASTK